MRATHTYALMEISAPAFNEIAQKLLKAGYTHNALLDFRELRQGSRSLVIPS